MESCKGKNESRRFEDCRLLASRVSFNFKLFSCACLISVFLKTRLFYESRSTFGAQNEVYLLKDKLDLCHRPQRMRTTWFSNAL